MTVRKTSDVVNAVLNCQWRTPSNGDLIGPQLDRPSKNIDACGVRIGRTQSQRATATLADVAAGSADNTVQPDVAPVGGSGEGTETGYGHPAADGQQIRAGIEQVAGHGNLATGKRDGTRSGSDVEVGNALGAVHADGPGAQTVGGVAEIQSVIERGRGECRRNQSGWVSGDKGGGSPRAAGRAETGSGAIGIPVIGGLRPDGLGNQDRRSKGDEGEGF